MIEREYCGNWFEGKQHGRGKYILPDGQEKVQLNVYLNDYSMESGKMEND